MPPGDSPIPSVSSGPSSPLSATSAPPTLGQPKGGSSSQDRKIPPPIGTERLARIRQGGSVAQAPVGTSFVAPVGHSGIWSFGVNAVSGTVMVQENLVPTLNQGDCLKLRGFQSSFKVCNVSLDYTNYHTLYVICMIVIYKIINTELMRTKRFPLELFL